MERFVFRLTYLNKTEKRALFSDIYALCLLCRSSLSNKKKEGKKDMRGHLPLQQNLILLIQFVYYAFAFSRWCLFKTNKK